MVVFRKMKGRIDTLNIIIRYAFSSIKQFIGFLLYLNYLT